jgi:intergrase/recombinase
MKQLRDTKQQFEQKQISEKQYNNKRKLLLTRLSKALNEIANHDDIKKINECTVKHCAKQHTNNFSTLAKFYSKQCDKTRSQKDCDIKELARKLAAKPRITADDVKAFTDLERKPASSLKVKSKKM